jgi:hypothetical protein
MNAIKNVKSDQVSNDAKVVIEYGVPYVVNVTIEGAADILFHRWSDDDVAIKAAAAKGSKGKKTDNIESYVYRTPDNLLAIPGENFRQSIIAAAKFKQDPRSPRKSAMDLYKAGIVTLTPFASLGTDKWDYEDRRRVMIQRNAITRVRPAMRKGWRASFDLMVNIPEYIEPSDLRETIEQAGRLSGLCDMRPTYGRFGIINYKVST